MTLLRGHLARAVSAASTGAIQLASLAHASDEVAIEAVDDAIGELMRAIIIAMESIDIDPEMNARRHLYRDLVDYVGHAHPRLLGDAPTRGATR